MLSKVCFLTCSHQSYIIFKKADPFFKFQIHKFPFVFIIQILNSIIAIAIPNILNVL